MTLALDVSGLSYYFGSKCALNDVSFAVESASFTALLGPNGAGKTTFFSLATRLFDCPPDTIRIFGHDVRRNAGEALAQLGVVFQEPTLDLDLTVVQNLRYAAALHGLSRRTASERIERELARFGLTERRDEKARRLNGGHRRRIEIARALLHRPALLLLDEPTVGLDVPTRRQLVELVHQLCREDSIAVLWTTHLVDELDPGSDRVVLLHKGHVEQYGTIPEVLAAANAKDLQSLFEPMAAPS
jgi:ABC-2 type transport system ATP-binding protein